MATPPSRESLALSIARQHRLTHQWLPDGRVRVYTDRGQALSSDTYADPVEAYEAAQALLTAGKQREAEHRARRLFDALERALYAPWPRLKANGSYEWLVLRVTDRAPQGPPLPGLLAALHEIARLVSEPAVVD